MKRQLKTITAYGISLSFAVVLVGCGSEEQPQKPQQIERTEAGNSIEIIHDNETGCEYIATEALHSYETISVIPRLDKNGVPMCGVKK